MNNNSWNKLTPIHYAWEEHKNTFQKQFCASEETEVISTQNTPLRTPVLDHVPTKGIWRKKGGGEMRDRALQRCFYPQWKSEVQTWFLTAWIVRSALFTVIPHATVIIEWELFPSPPWYFKCLFSGILQVWSCAISLMILRKILRLQPLYVLFLYYTLYVIAQNRTTQALLQLRKWGLSCKCRYPKALLSTHHLARVDGCIRLKNTTF